VETAISKSSRAIQERVIKARQGLIGINFTELWQYRELFLFMTWRNVLIRYKQTVIGIAWAVIRPVLMMLVFTLIFGKVANLPSDGVPYPILTFVALLPWQFFANSVSESSSSLIASPALISKIYFPRLIIPSASAMSGIVDFIVSFTVFIGLMVWYRFVPTLNVLWLPLFFLLALMSSLGISLWFSAMNVKYRDVRHAVPFLVQLGLFVSPVAYTSSVLSSRIPEKWQLIYWLNPMAGVIDGFRWALLGTNIALNYHGLALSAGMALVLLVTGAIYFRNMEKTFADVI